MIKKHNHSSESINRLVIEKPFGKDTDDGRDMMSSIGKDWKEEEIYRIDHYLGERAYVWGRSAENPAYEMMFSAFQERR